MFDPSWFWIDLLVFFLGDAYHFTGVVKNHTAGAGGPLIDRSDVFWHI
jgi:hypothetical protein